MNEKINAKKHIAILGGGPSGLFMYKRLIETENTAFEISIIEKRQQLGAGTPYSKAGARSEHITNVSDHEIPTIVTSVEEWIKVAPQDLLDSYNITSANFNEYKVLPRLFFGEYLMAQFEMLKTIADSKGFTTNVYYGSNVIDIIDKPNLDQVEVEIEGKDRLKFDKVIISTGHYWPIKHEGKVKGYFDSPYPPSKIALHLNHPVGIKGSSLTAIDAIRTLARKNGRFKSDGNNKLSYQLNHDSQNFKLIMHSRNGLLPAVRIHFEEIEQPMASLLSKADLIKHREQNNGFISLDYLFKMDFKETIRKKDPDFYEIIKQLSLEEFVDKMMALRENLDPFLLLQAEYAEAKKSIKRKESVYWKEMLSVLSVAMNYPAKYLSAEDMLRLKKTLMPLISIVIAFVPQSSCEELMALHEASIVELAAVGDGEISIQNKGGVIYEFTDQNNKSQHTYYQTFINCVGQPHLSFADIPFESLLTEKVISPAKVRFNIVEEAITEIENGNKDVERAENGDYFLTVPGVAINDDYQIIDQYGAFNPRIYMMAVPFMGGFNPDYSGLDFCAAASKVIIESLSN
jgi:uncharacterized NAD(P)/FAD-binding protein YdhS